MKNIFNNTEIAFSLKNDAELSRAYFLFKLISKPSLVKAGTGIVNFSLKSKLPVEWLIRKTVFNHFCGGTNEVDSLKVVEKLHSKNVFSILDYSVEGKEEDKEFDKTLSITLKTIEIAKRNQTIPFAVFKPTGFGRIDLFEKVSANASLTPQEQEEWDRVVLRFDTVCNEAHQKDIHLLIDAEESWMQNAADDLSLKMMQKYNKEKAIVFNTLQMYRWDRLDYLKKIHQKANQEGFFIGMKIVRGAYMEKENLRAKEKGYPTPICPSKEATDKNYDAVIEYMIQDLERMSIYAGTHNEESSYRLIELMQEKNISSNHPKIWFGQLYGMSDHISFNLAKNGYNSSKYLPFGSVKEVMPYLIRRAEENTSVAGQTSRELSLLTEERNRRKNKK